MLLVYTAKTLTYMGGVKPPPKCCTNALVAVLFCNNFVGFLVSFTKKIFRYDVMLADVIMT